MAKPRLIAYILLTFTEETVDDEGCVDWLQNQRYNTSAHTLTTLSSLEMRLQFTKDSANSSQVRGTKRRRGNKKEEREKKEEGEQRGGGGTKRRRGNKEEEGEQKGGGGTKRRRGNKEGLAEICTP